MDTNTSDADKSNNRPTQKRLTLGRRVFFGTLGSVGFGAIAGCTGSGEQGTGSDANGNGKEFRDAATAYLSAATLYKAPNCNCCLEYKQYLESTTEAAIKVVKVDDLARIKTKYNVPRNVESCHTLDSGEYFIEGHIPREAIGKLALEEPDILGIALPDMPAGSPGMSGQKTEEFVIYAVEKDGSSHEFMRI